MTIDPTPAWAVVVDGEIKYVRVNKVLAEASAKIEMDVYGEVGSRNVKVVPVLMTEIEGS